MESVNLGHVGGPIDGVDFMFRRLHEINNERKTEIVYHLNNHIQNNSAKLVSEYDTLAVTGTIGGTGPINNKTLILISFGAVCCSVIFAHVVEKLRIRF
jgi:hypothetical protein